jgi:hypothetical protein
MTPQDNKAGKIANEIPFTAADLVGLGLGQAFWKAVIEDTEFKVLRKAAMKADPLFDFMYLHQANHLWPVCPPLIFKILSAENPKRYLHMQDISNYKPPPAVVIAEARLEALCVAFGVLFRNRQLETVGHLVASHDVKASPSLGAMDTISPGIWAQERFCFHDLTGDIFEHIPAPKDADEGGAVTGPPMAWRWTGVAIQWPAVAPGPDKVRNRGGRPPKFNWEYAVDKTSARCGKEGTPHPGTVLLKWFMEYAAAPNGDVPDERTACAELIKRLPTLYDEACKR